MKNKITYLVIFIFSASLFSYAKKINSCKKTSDCAELIKQKSNESIKAEPAKGTGKEVPSLEIFFFNI